MAVTINQTTGAVTVEATTATEQKTIATVKLTVVLNGKSGEKTADVIQLAADEVITYEEPVVTLSYDKVPAAGGTVEATYSYTQHWTTNYGNSGDITDGGILTFELTDLTEG